MEKWQIGLIITIIGAIIILYGLSNFEFTMTDPNKSNICLAGVSIGGLIGIIGLVILRERFLGWARR